MTFTTPLYLRTTERDLHEHEADWIYTETRGEGLWIRKNQRQKNFIAYLKGMWGSGNKFIDGVKVMKRSVEKDHAKMLEM